MLLASWFTQDHGKEIVEMKAVEGQRSLRNEYTRDVCFHRFNKYTNGSHGKILFAWFVFHLLLNCDLIEETLVAHGKCVDYQIGTHLSILKLYSINFWLTCVICMVPSIAGSSCQGRSMDKYNKVFLKTTRQGGMLQHFPLQHYVTYFIAGEANRRIWLLPHPGRAGVAGPCLRLEAPHGDAQPVKQAGQVNSG